MINGELKVIDTMQKLLSCLETSRLVNRIEFYCGTDYTKFYSQVPIVKYVME